MAKDKQANEGEVVPLIVDGVATSPFEEYPGTITFPAKFTPKMYRDYKEAMKIQDDDIEDPLMVNQWHRAIFVLGDVKVEGLDPDFDNCADMLLIRWAAEVGAKYAFPFLIERPWHRTSGDGAKDKD